VTVCRKDKLEVATYNNWKFAMKMYLIHEDLWNYIIETNVNSEQGQCAALEKICLSIKPAFK